MNGMNNMKSAPADSVARGVLYYALVVVALSAAAIGAVGAQHAIAQSDALSVALGVGLAFAGAAIATHAPAWYWRAPRRRSCRSAMTAVDIALAVIALLAAAQAARGAPQAAFAAATVAAGCCAAGALAILAAARAADHAARMHMPMHAGLEEVI